MSAFDEVRLPPNIDRGARGGPAFSTTVVVTASGAEQRIAQWTRPRMRWTVGHSLRTAAQMSELLNFFMTRRGRLRGWRLKDWSDFSSSIGGVETQHDTLVLTSNTFQLQKVYSSGGVSVARKITKPVSDTLGDTAATRDNSTVRIYTDTGTEIMGGWIVDASSGIVTFGSAPGFTPKATYEYDIPVRFDHDSMQLSLDETTYSSWQGIECVELLL